jgi:2-iminoacetate synthase
VKELDQLIEKDTTGEIFQEARRIRDKNFGKKICIFAPLYLSNECENFCLYCGFRKPNRKIIRKTLSIEQAVAEAGILAEQGHKRILLVSAENTTAMGIDKISRIIKEIYKNTGIASLSVNSAPASVEEFRRLKKAGAVMYQVFQETYHQPTYKKLHPGGKKSDYLWRLKTLERAAEAGFEELSTGFLLGLYDWRFEITALYDHIKSLDSRFDNISLTVSVPRMRPAIGAVMKKPAYPVSDMDLKRIVSLIRILLPKTRITISTRERAGFRMELLDAGADVLSAGSRTSPGGYSCPQVEEDKSQFLLEDLRSLPEVIKDLEQNDYIPCLCAGECNICKKKEGSLVRV